ncbi:MAG: tetratricopeptide repeat protein [Nitrospirae bacterium]|nr:tetratricopeptide repeat protein [Nitrospirota bacterium]
MIFRCVILLLLLLPSLSFADSKKVFSENSRSIVLVKAYSDKGEDLTEGTGFFASADGAIVTNYHVIGIADKVRVWSGSRELQVEGVIYADKENDLVILKAKGSSFPAVRFADAGKINSKDQVYLISASTEAGNTIHEGVFDGYRTTPSGTKAIHITAPASHGESGSPVFTKDGAVIGIVTFLIKRAERIILAMPASLITEKISDRNIASLDKTIKNYKKTADYWFYLGYFLIQVKADKEAAQVLREAIRLKPGFAEAHYYLGIACEKLDRNKEAIKAYKEAVRLSPDFTDAHFSLGVIYGKKGMYKESLDALKQAIRLDNDFPDAYYYMGIAYANLGMFKEGIEANKQAVKLKPDFADAYYNLGIANQKTGNYKDAISSLQQAVKLKPGFAEAHYYLGILYLTSNNKTAAIESHNILKVLNKELAGKLFKLIYG